MDEKRKATGMKLLEAAQYFWDACQQEGQYGAIQWLEGSCGELLIYTRGEYRQQLLNNIHGMPSSKIHFFRGEIIPNEEPEDEACLGSSNG